MSKHFPFEPQYRKAMEVKLSGHSDEAAQMLSELATVYPDVVLLRWQLGYAHLEAGAPDKSVQDFKEAVRLDPECFAAWGGLGQAYEELSEWDLAEEAFRKRLAIKESPNIYLFLSGVLRAKGDVLGALRCCERAIDLRPADDEAYLNLGLTLVDLRLWDQAVEAFEKAIALDPDDPRAIGELGFLRFGQGDHEVAEGLLRRALACREFPACVHLYLAFTLEAKALYAEAESEFNAALGADPDDELFVREYREFRRRQSKRRGSLEKNGAQLDATSN